MARVRANRDPLAVGRHLIRGRVYWVLVFLRILSCVPSALAVYEYLSEAVVCYTNTGSFDMCALNTWLPAVWCLVSGYMTLMGLDGMIVRWVFTYSQPAAIFRTVTCVLLNYLAIFGLTHFTNSSGTTDLINLQIWILISVLLTTLYILQTFITSNMGATTMARTLDLFHIAVYAVIPIGLASFLTMLALIRTLMLVQLYYPKVGGAL